MLSTETESKLDLLFEDLLDILRKTWHQSNAASVLLSIFFFKRLLALELQGLAPSLNLEQAKTLRGLSLRWQGRIEAGENPAELVEAIKRARSFLGEDLWTLFQPLISALEQEIYAEPLLGVFQRLRAYDFSASIWSIGDFGQFFASKLRDMALHAGKIGEQWTTPPSLNTLLAYLANVGRKERVYEPAVGYGGTVAALYQLVPNLRVYAQERDPRALAWCRMNLWMQGIWQVDLRQGDALDEVIPPLGGWADVALGHFPFSPSVSSAEVKGKPYLAIPFDVKHTQTFSPYQLFIQLMLYHLNDKGRLLALIPTQALYKDRQDRRLREYLLMKDWVEAVISLPSGLMYASNLAPSILILNKAKRPSRQNKILFINATNILGEGRGRFQRQLSLNQIHCLNDLLQLGPKEVEPSCLGSLKDCVSEVELHEVIAQQYNLNPKRYASHFIKAFKDKESKYPIQSLSEIFEPDVPYVWFDASFQRNFPYVQIEDLAQSFADYPLSLDDLDKTTNEKSEGRLVTQSALLVAANHKQLRLSYFNYQGQSVVVDSDIMIFSINEKKIHLEFLLLQMFDPLFSEQLSIFRSDDEAQRISERAFVQLVVAMPKRPVQELEAREIKLHLLKEEEHKVERLRQKLNLDKQQAQSEQHKIISSLQHELGNRLPALLGEFRILKDYLSDKIEAQEPLNWQDPVLPLFEDEDPQSIDQLGTIIQRMEALIRYGLGAIDATSDIIRADRSKMQLAEVNLKELLEEVCQLYAHERNFSIQIEVEEDENGEECQPKVLGDRAQLLTALVNLVENAKKHGFCPDKKYLVRFHLVQSKEEAIILYKNDGRPFPENYRFEDFVSYGNYAGQTGHSGIGGYLVKRIMDNHDGQLQLLENIGKNDPFKVQFELSLPLA